MGVGIKLISHLTHESKVTLQKADHVFYVSCNPYMDEYIKQLNPHCESLNPFYFQAPNRQTTYQMMTDKVVNYVKTSQQNVCMVFYGHPCVYAIAGIAAIKELRMQGYQAVALPAISALDCVFADLLINAHPGVSCFEATDLVMEQRALTPHLYTTIWQPYMYKQFSTIKKADEVKDKEEVFAELKHYLLTYYPPQHEIIIYRAAMVPGEDFSSTEVVLAELAHNMLSVESTLVLPPLKTRS